MLAACFCMLYAQAAYLKDIPVTVTQPDGTVLHCLASGDEFFNYLHDANGYTIIQHPVTGYYVYADKQDGKLVPTDFIAGKYDPTVSKQLKPYNLISNEEYQARRKAWEVPDPRPKNRDIVPNHGTLNNIAIFIRFSDDGEFANTYSSIDNMFNDMSGSYSASMRSYFQAVSYGAIDIPTTFYPGHNDETIISYQDSYPKSYFQPYNESTNPNGYQEEDRTQREFDLLERAVNYINANYPIPSDLNIDYDSDGYVDNVCFIVKGSVDGWSDLLWPHKWNLQDRTVRINGKRVWTFNFQLADATSYFNTSTMCHEMNHSLSAPDLYHYDNDWKQLDPVGKWDLMKSNTTPPQHMGAYMKMRYGHWIDEIPEITQAGTYTLNPISSATPTNVAYKIASSDPNQFYVLEYRNKNVETAIPGSGLLIYRIDTRFHGNADYNPNEGIYDEVYIFRLNGTSSANGSINSAHFSSTVHREEFSSSTNPRPFLSDGSLDNNMRIYNITSEGETISFTYGSTAQCEPPTNLQATLEGNTVTLTWDAATGAVSYNVYRDGNLIGNTAATTYTDYNLRYGSYEYTLKSKDSEDLLSFASEPPVTAEIDPIPLNLAATEADGDALLTWDIPYPKTPQSTLTYGTQNLSSAYMNWQNYLMYWGHRYRAENLSAYANTAVYSIEFHANNPGVYEVCIYQGTTQNGNYYIPTAQIANERITVTATGWNTVDLISAPIIDASQDLWVFIHNPESIDNLRSYVCEAIGATKDGFYYSQDLTVYTSNNISDYAFLLKTHLADATYTYNLYDGTTSVATAIEGTTYTITNITSEDAAHLYTLTTNTSNGETDASNLAGLTVGTASLSSLTMAVNDKMTVTEGSQLTVSGTLSNSNAKHLILEDGARLVNSSEGVKATVKKAITPYTEGEKDGWNLIASPMTENLTATNVTGLLSNDYDLYIFDQSQSLEWRNYETNPKPFTTIDNKKGYLYANSGNTTLNFTGTLAATADATSLVYDANASFKGFNLIGNPYPCNTYVTGRSFYVLQDNATTHQSEFILGANPIPPCAAILVEAQNGGESVTFSKTAPDASPAPQGLTVTVSKANLRGEGLLDKARISFNEGERLTKFNKNTEGGRLYIPQDGKEFAVACISNDGDAPWHVSTEIPVNFKAAENGTYTLAIEVDEMDLAYLYLIDNMTGENIDLLASRDGACTVSTAANYTFEAKTTDYASRFRLVFAPMDGPSTPSTGSGAFAYYSDGEIRFVETCHGASLQIVDMTGRVIRVCTDGACTVSTSEITPGVYVLRLIDGENVRTQKIVIE